MTDVFSEVHRLLIPGGHGLIWSLPRTNDLTTLALRLAGFDIRDVVAQVVTAYENPTKSKEIG